MSAKEIELSTNSAQNQMNFQREMSNTAHQREILDLQAAGLNPVLSAKLGGASTPTGAAGDYSDPNVGELAKAVTTLAGAFTNVLGGPSNHSATSLGNDGNVVNDIDNFLRDNSSPEAFADWLTGKKKINLSEDIKNLFKKWEIVPASNFFGFRISKVPVDRKGNYKYSGIPVSDIVDNAVDNFNSSAADRSAIANRLKHNKLWYEGPDQFMHIRNVSRWISERYGRSEALRYLFKNGAYGSQGQNYMYEYHKAHGGKTGWKADRYNAYSRHRTN